MRRHGQCGGVGRALQPWICACLAVTMRVICGSRVRHGAARKLNSQGAAVDFLLGSLSNTAATQHWSVQVYG